RELPETPAAEELRSLTAEIVAAHVGNNEVALTELPILIASIHQALAGASTKAEPPPKPAVPIRSSVKPDYLVSLESGKKVKMLRRYLMTNYGMTPDEYRRKWGLPNDYPMVAATYAEQRRGIAKKMGLGRGGKKAVKQGRPAAKAVLKPRDQKAN